MTPYSKTQDDFDRFYYRPGNLQWGESFFISEGCLRGTFQFRYNKDLAICDLNKYLELPGAEETLIDLYQLGDRADEFLEFAKGDTDYFNNSYSDRHLFSYAVVVELEKKVKDVDFSITSRTKDTTVKKEKGNFELEFLADLAKSNEQIDTTVTLYKGNTPLETKKLQFQSGIPELITFNINKDSLSVGNKDLNYQLKKTAKVEYIDYGMYSDQWHNYKDGQIFAHNNNLPDGKGLDGKPAEDELMTKIKYYPLKQSIFSGRGFEIRTKIVVSGTVEEYGKFVDKKVIEDFIDDFKYGGAVYASGKSGIKGTNDGRNNKGEYTQKMEFDEERSKEYKLDIKNESPITYGKKNVYRTNFRAEIPLIISKATGEIDIIGGEKADVPNERRWFTYLNDFDGVYGIKIVTTLDPSKLGSDAPKTECVLAPEEFKYGIYGTMFEDSPGLDIIDDWDN